MGYALEEIQEKFPQSFAAKQSKEIALQLKTKAIKKKSLPYKWVFPHHRKESLWPEKDIKNSKRGHRKSKKPLKSKY